MSESGGKSDDGVPQKEFDPKRDAAAVKKLEGWDRDPATDPVLSTIPGVVLKKPPQERRHKRYRDGGASRV